MRKEYLVLIYLTLAFPASEMMGNRSESTGLSTTVLLAARLIGGFLAIVILLTCRDRCLLSDVICLFPFSCPDTIFFKLLPLG